MSKEVNQSSNDLFTRTEAWCNKHQKAIIWSILGLFSFMSLLLFNLRVSEGGDDSTYIIRALSFINNGSYPSFQGPLYPLFLSLFVRLFGINLGLLKLTSFIMMAVSVWLTYKIFKDKVAYTLLFTMLIITSLSSHYIYFTSQTYSEALFIFIQLPVFYLVFSIIDSEKINYKYFVYLSMLILAAYLTRTVGVGLLIAAVIFFVLSRKYKQAGIVIAGFAVMLLLFLGLKSIIWEVSIFDDGQASTLMYKHPYQPDKGMETPGGFVKRFIDNSNQYLSKHFLQMTGFRDATKTTTYGLLTILLYAIFGFSLARALKKNKYILFVGIYLMIMLGITFVVLQKLWDQYRLIVPFFPFMVLFLLYALWDFSKNQKGKIFQYLFFVLIGIGCISATTQSFSKVDLLTLRKNIKGDLYEGYTDDWKHYLSMTEYAGKQLPKNTLVAARKPNMARIYANGKTFYGIYRFDTKDPDKLLQRLKERNVTHVIMASLRKNPRVNNGQTINTIQRYLYIISQKYPMVFKLEHQIGKVEPAFLFRVDYDAAVAEKQ